MRYTGLFYLGFLLPIASALGDWDPNVQTVTIQLSNDHSGANVNKCIPEDGKKYPVSSFWGNTALSQHGGIYATSGQLVAFKQNTACTIECPHGDLGFNHRKTWLSFAQGQVINLQDATVSCQEKKW
ncbi:hypothetical protein PENARI_c031G04231 [Penicillium arizonense]|uniref:Cyanovirin-N domain-containing protein n=1 Tax=Penicillium arizonense TaxID=1835702 RepID=A0A1F5L4U8_PENAI|nr:hypothetical protein PENARI_c031G04231 [Penicillium arizonense]OGE48222.1 hypothetical protein PENARI_c031G04231 [Penicillium arizonense]